MYTHGILKIQLFKQAALHSSAGILHSFYTSHSTYHQHPVFSVPLAGWEVMGFLTSFPRILSSPMAIGNDLLLITRICGVYLRCSYNMIDNHGSSGQKGLHFLLLPSKETPSKNQSCANFHTVNKTLTLLCMSSSGPGIRLGNLTVRTGSS